MSANPYPGRPSFSLTRRLTRGYSQAMDQDASSARALRDLAREAPPGPGVYLFKDPGGRILYVGKAKNLKRRLASYFRQGEMSLAVKTRAMLAAAASLDTLVTATEKEALLLEAGLIKKHKPRFNIVLRDDKSFILFKLEKRAEYPRLTLTRRVLRDGSVYYGPFTSALAARETWKAVQAMFPLRRCKDSVFRNRVRPCLYHQIGLCLGPCVLDVGREEYAALVRQVELLLSGRSGELTRALAEQMQAASKNLEYEQAARLRDRIRAVQQTIERQAVVLPGGGDLDVLGLAAVEAGLALCVLFVRQGRLLDKKTFFWPNVGLEDGPEALAGFLGQFYGAGSRGSGRFVPERILLPLAPSQGEAEGEDDDWGVNALAELLSEERKSLVRISCPASARDKGLLAMARSNALQDAEKRGREDPGEALARKLGLAAPPRRIEAVDVSHTQGEETRVGLVVFEQGRPAKDSYRLYALPQGVAQGDDYAALASFVEQRLASGPPWPDLLLIDGGKGQLAAVERSLEGLDRTGLFPLAAIAKARDRDLQGGQARRRAHALEDRVFLPGRKNPLPLRPGSAELLFLQHVRDTVHNYVIGRHRRARTRKALSGELLGLPGIGPKTARLLWDHFPSLEAMAEATEDDLAAIPGLGRKRAAALGEELRKLKG